MYRFFNIGFKIIVSIFSVVLITQALYAKDSPSIDKSLGENPDAFLILQIPNNDQKISKLAIDKKAYIKINGIQQYIMIKGENLNNPVLLYLHGGPGLSGMGKEPLMRNLEKLYTVVYWDQRGTGKTYEKNHSSDQIDPKNKPTIDNMIEDTRQVVQYLKKIFHKNKIAILGHSWGSVLGSEFVLKYPEDVLYYIGVGQVTNAMEDERIVYEHLYDIVSRSGNKEDLKALNKISKYPYFKDENEIFKDLIMVRTLQAKYKIINTDIKPTAKSQKSYHKNGPIYSNIYKYMMGFDLYKTTDYKIPVYYILGMHDWQVPTVNAIKYFYKINAPKKELFLIPNAGHSTMTDQPRAFFNALKVILETK
ncbi:alpha/beta fold hydrolase [Helicobacter cappadocius]|uniref:Alpha/beta hydrolase n=1 Tax=Helicobacter cappadocius TaxID=3063998 RepID=A0AA90SS07_9HELI|nr:MULTISPECIES: alpha/beta hydrolase [unclassified Helicobacter]MDO7252532.1 alpha/beta hydrolase [Helicobacter sp. faydin-H75]MDP2538399.1 alpha/beta hydrolase [Helicobacter sp. faydin-H76]